MREFTATPLETERYSLGEGIRWDEVRGELAWVDIATTSSRMMRARVVEGGLDIFQTYEFEPGFTVFAPFEDRARGWMAGYGDALVHLTEDGQTKRLVTIVTEDADVVRTNDGSADPWGGFWVGTMGKQAQSEFGSLYWYRDGEVTTVRSKTTIANGTSWSPDLTTMYWTDSALGTIFRASVQADGTPGPFEPFIVLPDPSEAAPDGHCVDENGHLWVAVWGAREVREYNSAGEQVGRVKVDARQVSCCTLGGPTGTTLFITTAQEGYSAEDSASDPHAGNIFSCDIGVRGRPLLTVR